MALTLAVTRMTPAPDPLIADVVADHVRSMMNDHLTDVSTSDQHTVKPWLRSVGSVAGGLGFWSRAVPLVGGRLDYINGHRAAATVYRRDRHVINLVESVSDNPADSPPRQQARDGFNVVTYVAVSDVEVPPLLAFIRLVLG